MPSTSALPAGISWTLLGIRPTDTPEAHKAHPSTHPVWSQVLLGKEKSTFENVEEPTPEESQEEVPSGANR